jgi:hypothetical protein
MKKNLVNIAIYVNNKAHDLQVFCYSSTIPLENIFRQPTVEVFVVV